MSVLYCSDFDPDGRACCISCHEDADNGYIGLQEVYEDFLKNDELYALVCCRLTEAAELRRDGISLSKETT